MNAAYTYNQDKLLKLRFFMKSQKRGPYHVYSPETRAAIGEYASVQGLSAASCLYKHSTFNQEKLP